MKVWHTLRYQFRNPLVIFIHIASWVLLLFVLEVVIDRKLNNILQFLKNGLSFLTVLGFITSYRETRGKLIGIATTQQNWINWYHNQEQQMSDDQNIDTPPLSENLGSDSVFIRSKNTVLEMFRNPLVYVFHFICWNFALIFGILLDDSMQYTIRDKGPLGVFQIIDYIASDMKSEFFFDGIVVIAILAVTTSVQDVKGKLKGIAKEQQQWLKGSESQTDSLIPQSPLEASPSLITNKIGQLFVIQKPIYTVIHILIVIVFLSILSVQLILITEWSGIKFFSWIALLILLLY